MGQLFRSAPFPALGDLPEQRCGHTLTSVHAGDQLLFVLYGGATDIESTKGNTEGGRLSSATSSAYVFVAGEGKWIKLQPQGESPSPRTAHSAIAVGSVVVIQGGYGPEGLVSGDLHVLDLTNWPQSSRWHRLFVSGQGPKERYGHVLELVSMQYLVVFGGADGTKFLNDVWCMDITTKPYVWKAINPSGPAPQPRSYASGAVNSDGDLFICGGRIQGNVAMGDCSRLHLDPSTQEWSWSCVSSGCISPRYLHSCTFLESLLIVTGGVVSKSKLVEPGFEVLEIRYNENKALRSEEVVASPLKLDVEEDTWRRFRHTVVSVLDGKFLVMYGGLKRGKLMDDLFVLQFGDVQLEDDKASSSWMQWSQVCQQNPHSKSSELQEMEIDENSKAKCDLTEVPEAMPLSPMRKNASGFSAFGQLDASKSSDKFQLHHRAAVSINGLVKLHSISRFQFEKRRNKAFDPTNLSKQESLRGIHKKVISKLLHHSHVYSPSRNSFFLSFSEISELCADSQSIISEESAIIRLKKPVKIFGDLHGQYEDLIRLFTTYGMPLAASGDITYIDYLFMGDFVDRGPHSLEVICILLALKVEYPKYVHMIRGNHEDPDVNAIYGFRTECLERLGEDEGVKAWNIFNDVFKWLPLVATIDDKIFCVHGGVGRCYEDKIETLIESLPRPLTRDQGGQVMTDLLWSDPTENDSVLGIQQNKRGPGLVTFGPDIVKKFNELNNFQLVVRAHECVMDGFERAAGGALITVFSATNYCGVYKNKGAILVVGRDMSVYPRLLEYSPEDRDLEGSEDKDDEYEKYAVREAD